MKFAIIDGLRYEAQPNVHGQCPGCGAKVVAKCGTKRIWHWAHFSARKCDGWWEAETAWHREWKGGFPNEWQEVRHVAPDGELHIADVNTEHGIILEFQHSNISPDERESRERFHGQMAWVVDGTRLKRDLSSFHKAIVDGRILASEHLQYRISVSTPIVERWSGGKCPVYLDFGRNKVRDTANEERAHTLVNSMGCISWPSRCDPDRTPELC